MTQWSVDRPQTIELGQVEKVKVRLIGGHVDVVGSEGPARLEVSAIEGPPLEVRLEGSTLELTYDDLSWRGLLSWKRGVRRNVTMSLAVPASCPVELGVVSASAVVAGMAGPASVKSVSGGVTLDGLGGPMDGQTVSGDLETRGLGGPLRFKTVSGDLTVIDGASGIVRATTVSGDITVDLVVPDDALRRDVGLDVDSVSGDVTVRLPDDADVQVDVKTTTGDLDSAFDGLHRERRPGSARLEGTLGRGGGKVTARTVSGDVALLRRSRPQVSA
ncbi:MAG: DUF4097 family beta strand repeat-containing protein [Actinomycetes bacterium]